MIALIDLIKELPSFSSLRKFLIESSNRPKRKSDIHCWGKIKVSPETFARNLLDPEDISITTRQACKKCGTKKFEIVSFLKGAWRRDYSPQYVKPENYRETFCFKERERQNNALKSLKLYFKEQEKKEKFAEQAHAQIIMRNLEILVGKKGDLSFSKRDRLRRDYAIYRLYRYLNVSPRDISRLWSKLEEDLSREEGTVNWGHAYDSSKTQVTIGRIFTRECFKEKCILKPYLFREALTTRRISS